MRVLIASTEAVAHFRVLEPFARVLRDAGNEVLVCGPPLLREQAEGFGFEFCEFESSMDHVGALRFRSLALPPEQREPFFLREMFGRVRPRAGLPMLSELCRTWRPDVVVRESAEFSSAIAAERYRIPHLRVGVGLAEFEAHVVRVCREPLDELARSVDVSDFADGVLDAPYLTYFPTSLEDPSGRQNPTTMRFRQPSSEEPAGELRYQWDGNEDPLIYVTFGTIAARMPRAAAIYPIAIEAIASLPVRAVLSVGPSGDPEAFGPLPGNLRVEKWVDEPEVMAQASAMVSHGGVGSMLNALMRGLPVACVPLMADQQWNADRLTGVGAGARARQDAGSIREAVLEVLEDDRYRTRAGQLADEMRTQLPCEAILGLIEQLPQSEPSR